jgi:hypothetical protein
VRSDEHILLDDDFPIADRAARAEVEVRENRRSKPDGAVITDRDFVRMQFVDIDELGNPHVVPNVRPANAMKPWPEAGAAWGNERNFVKKAAKNHR